MDSEYSVMVSNKFAGLLMDEEDQAEMDILIVSSEKSKDEVYVKDSKKKQIVDKKLAKSGTKDAVSRKENINNENKKDSKCAYVVVNALLPKSCAGGCLHMHV